MTMHHQCPRRTFLLTSLVLSLLACLVSAAELELKPPDGKVAIRLDLKTVGELNACPVYRVSFRDHPVLADSRIGSELRDGLRGERFPSHRPEEQHERHDLEASSRRTQNHPRPF